MSTTCAIHSVVGTLCTEALTCRASSRIAKMAPLRGRQSRLQQLRSGAIAMVLPVACEHTAISN